MNGILLIDKPEGFTSHDVVAKLRGITRERRIGHSGTLDPMATGLLVVFLGRATRAVQFAENHEKEYTAKMRCGLETDTQDITGAILKTSGIVPGISELEGVLRQFTGEIEQIPPMYSAIKINGQKLYDIARRGGEVERAPRRITIRRLELLGQEEGDFVLQVCCSKGTYIRTLCNDIGASLGCGAALSGLRRSKCGEFDVKNAFTLSKIQNLTDRGELEAALLPVDSLFAANPDFTLNDAQKKKCLVGNSFPAETEDGIYRVYDASGSFIMLGEAKDGEMYTVKSFFEV